MTRLQAALALAALPLVPYAMLFLLMLPGPCEAGRSERKERATSVRAARLQFRRDKLASGVTLTRAKTAYYRAKTASNITGLFNPMGWLFGGLL